MLRAGALSKKRGQGKFQPQLLVETLASFTSGKQAPLATADYYDFYQLDFRQAIPELVHSIGWVTSGPHRLAVQSFVPPYPLGSAIVCHGYYDHVGLFGHLLRFLLGRRLAVLAFDQPGHGLSSGPRASIDSFDEYVRALADTLDAAGSDLPKPWVILGQSMGGSIAMEYLVQRGAGAFTEVVLLAPLIRPAAWPINRVFYELAKRFISERPRTIMRNAENPEFLELMARDPLAPMTLPLQWVTAMIAWMERFESYPQLPFQPKVVQGHADKTVSWRYNLRMLNDKCSPEVLEIPAARHHLVNESSQIRCEMFAWLSERLPGATREPAC